MMQNKFFRLVSLGLLALQLPFCTTPKSDITTSATNQAGGVLASKANQNLTFYWVDVEGGAATLIVTPAGESVLIDSGNPGGRDADRIYKVAKEVAGLKQIDHLITTHWHLDHYGGAAELTVKMPVIEAHDKGLPQALPEDKEFSSRIQPYRDMPVKKRSQMQAGQTISLKSLPKAFQKLNLWIVGFDKKFVPVSKINKANTTCDVPDKAMDTSDNGNSTVLVLDYGPFRFFDGADLTWNVEKTLVCPDNLVGTVDVFQVNHHGLDQSNNPALVKALAPTVAVMNNGSRKGCGPETVTTLKNTPSVKGSYQLHKNIREDSQFNTADEFIANLEEKCQANYVQLTVEPDGKKYTVSIPANNHTATYSTKTMH